MIALNGDCSPQLHPRAKITLIAITRSLADCALKIAEPCELEYYYISTTDSDPQGNYTSHHISEIESGIHRVRILSHNFLFRFHALCEAASRTKSL